MKIIIKSFGCSANTADSEVMAGCLTKAGHKLVNKETEADILIFNTCAVKGPTENRIIDAIRQSPKNKKILIVGCLPKISFERLSKEAHFDGVAGPSIGEGIVELVRRVFAGERVVELEALKEVPKLSLPRINTNPVVSVLPINFGCLGSCAYCCVVFARGHLRSYGIEEIVKRVKADLALGMREFWVTSQDTACYGRDIGKNLADLLHALGSVEGDFMVRVGMMTPNIIVDMQDDLIESFRSEKIFKFLHLPIQSGDDEVLKGMRRFYSAKEFVSVVEAFRRVFPDLTLATDVIVGFPGETEEAFQNTLKILRQTKPDVTNVSKFFARPKTLAAQMKDGLVDKVETKHRSTVTAKLAKQLSAEQNKSWIGWVGSVLIDEQGKMAGSWIGRNIAYKPVVVKSNRNLLGKTVNVEIVGTSETYLIGIIK